MEKVDHIGIAVRNLEERITYYAETTAVGWKRKTLNIFSGKLGRTGSAR